MLLVLSKEQKKHLAFLSEVDISVVEELGQIAVEFLKNGSNGAKSYENAARKLNVPSEALQNAVEALMFLLTESAKLKISQGDFQDSVAVLGFSQELHDLLLRLYLETSADIRHFFLNLPSGVSHYSNMTWRLDVQLASRALRQQLKPALTLKLQLEEGTQIHKHVLQMNPATLQHVVQELERALMELKSNDCRRILSRMR